jgi:sugar lactone lactonase YvrE
MSRHRAGTVARSGEQENRSVPPGPRARPSGVALLCGLWLAALSGCAAVAPAPAAWGPKASFPDETAVPRVTVYGGLIENLPAYDQTPALDRFLYGPSDVGQTLLRNPQGMALAGGRLLVCDQGQPDVVAIDLSTGRSTRWTEDAHRPPCPVDVKAGADGRVYVADTTLRQVLVFDERGRFVEELSPAQRERFRPVAVVEHRGILYAANVGDRQVDRFDLSRRQWMSPLRAPADKPLLVAPTGLCMAGDVLLIVDAMRGCVNRVDMNGQWLPPIGRAGREAGQFIRPKQVCCAAGGLILVSDAGRQSVLVFDGDGRYLTEVRDHEKGWTGWTQPMGLLAAGPAELSGLLARHGKDGGAEAEGYVIVSDSLGGVSLTVLAVVSK